MIINDGKNTLTEERKALWIYAPRRKYYYKKVFKERL